MKPLDSDKKASKEVSAPAEAAQAAPVVEEKIDFSNVQIEPLFQDQVDFDTFSKSDFRAVKVKACEAVKKSKKLLKFTLDDGTGTDRIILSGIHAYYEPEELVKQLLKDRKFYETSGGGVTFSGGEPMLHPEYLAEVLRLCKEAGLHTAVDTAGCVPFESFETVLPWADLFLYDIKLWDEERHKAATGVSNRRILENLRLLTDAGASVFIRTPVIPTYSADLEELGHIAAFLAGLPHREGVRLIQLLPYHNYGVGKYRSLGSASQTEELRPPEDSFMQEALQRYLDLGLPAQIS